MVIEGRSDATLFYTLMVGAKSEPQHRQFTDFSEANLVFIRGFFILNTQTDVHESGKVSTRNLQTVFIISALL